MRAQSFALGLILVVSLATAGVARAEADLFSRETVSGVIDLRAANAGGERSWTDGGFGKLRFGETTTAQIAGADLVWKPRFSWAWSAMVDVQAQAGQRRPLDLGEAFVSFKPTPKGPTRFSARAGLYYPSISLEHGGGAWLVSDTITPSAINSWVGEELKVVGLEATLAHRFSADFEVSASAAVFGYDDTAGTLLALRGWALHDLKSSSQGRFGLPPLSPFMAALQPRFTSSLNELDSRAGWYGQATWRQGPVALSAFYEDNRGDRIAVNSDLEWSWQTRFWAFSADVDLTPDWRLRAQALTGTSRMGYATPQIWIDVDYQAAYAMLTRGWTADALSARLDAFAVGDRSWKLADPNQEHGWALTGAWRHTLNDHADLLVEALYVDSDRPARALAGLSPQQGQLQLQSALRLKF
jgi:hypothetical protein